VLSLGCRGTSSRRLLSGMRHPETWRFQPREGSRAGLIAILRSPAVLSVEVTNQQGSRGTPASAKLRARSLGPLEKTRDFGMTPQGGTK
jgi:hypothetical protein